MHAGYVAGRYRDGCWSDHWTDVARCAHATFTAYRPACRCGWSGPALPADRAGHAAALGTCGDHVQVVTGHHPAVPPCRPRPRPLPRPAWT